MTVSSPAPRRSRKRILVISVSAVIAALALAAVLVPFPSKTTSMSGERHTYESDALGSGEQADALPGAPEKNNGAQVTRYQGGGQ